MQAEVLLPSSSREGALHSNALLILAAGEGQSQVRASCQPPLRKCCRSIYGRLSQTGLIAASFTLSARSDDPEHIILLHEQSYQATLPTFVRALLVALSIGHQRFLPSQFYIIGYDVWLPSMP